MNREAQVASAIVQWLRQSQWTVYQEVQFGPGYPRADIVAVQHGRVWVIECKVSLTFAVIEQAEWWKYHAHWVSVGVPRCGWKAKGRRIAHRLLDLLGMGCVEVDQGGYVHEYADARLNRHAKAAELIERLEPEHQTYAAAGNDEGRHWSPFQRTCAAVQKYLTEHPGANLKTLVDGIETHYASRSTARACLSKWAQRGKIRGVEARHEGGQLRFYVANEKRQQGATTMEVA